MARTGWKSLEMFWKVLAVVSAVLVVLGTVNAVFGGGNWIIPLGPFFTGAAAVMSLIGMRRARRKQAENPPSLSE